MLIGSNIGCMIGLIALSICSHYAPEHPMAGNLMLVSAIFYMMLYPILGKDYCDFSSLLYKHPDSDLYSNSYPHFA